MTSTYVGRRRAALTSDARNRALRTLIQSLAADVGIAVLVALSAWWSASPDLSTREAWIGVAVLAGKTAITTALSYLMRRYADGSIPTPLPPAPVPEPVAPDLGERIVLTDDEVTRGVVQGEPFDPRNRPTNFGN